MCTITVNDIRDFCPTSASDEVIQCLIDFVNQADACFEANNVSAPTVKLLKTYAVCHMLENQNGGQVTSERDMDGASVTYANTGAGAGLSSTSSGRMIKAMDQYGCITAILDKPQRSAAILNYE